MTDFDKFREVLSICKGYCVKENAHVSNDLWKNTNRIIIGGPNHPTFFIFDENGKYTGFFTDVEELHRL